MKIRKIHYLEIGKAVTACGRSNTGLLLSDNPNHTRCKSCRRTRAWITAWEDWKGWKRERARPRAAVRRAIESDKLIRPDKCSLDEPLDDYHSDRIEAHHHNKSFDKEHWLDVIFLCHRCHNALTVGRAKLPTEV